MFYSEKYKLLVIGIPKTGTVTIEKALKEQLDPNGSFHSIAMAGQSFPATLFKQGIINHARAREFSEVMGDDYFKLTRIAFIRNPYSKLVSSYHFTKGLSLVKLHKGKKKKYLRTLKYSLSVLIAKYLPFSIWILFYPYRSSTSYIKNIHGEDIVDFVGRTESLELDLNKFLIQSGVVLNSGKIILGRENSSKRVEWKSYYKNPLVRKVSTNKMLNDIRDYENRFGKIKLV
jgi:hypothetical protein